jgi:hypothetical protein
MEGGEAMRLSDEMAKHWFSLPLHLRKRWWDETEYGKREPSEKLKQAVSEAIEKKEAVK